MKYKVKMYLNSKPVQLVSTEFTFKDKNELKKEIVKWGHEGYYGEALDCGEITHIPAEVILFITANEIKE